MERQDIKKVKKEERWMESWKKRLKERKTGYIEGKERRKMDGEW